MVRGYGCLWQPVPARHSRHYQTCACALVLPRRRGLPGSLLSGLLRLRSAGSLPSWPSPQHHRNARCRPSAPDAQRKLSAFCQGQAHSIYCEHMYQFSRCSRAFVPRPDPPENRAQLSCHRTRIRLSQLKCLPRESAGTHTSLPLTSANSSSPCLLCPFHESSHQHADSKRNTADLHQPIPFRLASLAILSYLDVSHSLDISA